MDVKKKKKKVLFIHPKLTFGGAEVLRLDILKNWNLSDYEVSLLCIEELGPIGLKIEKMGFPVYCLNQSAKPYNIKAAFLIYLFLLKNRFDIVQTSLFNANFHGRIAAFLAGVPYIFSEEHSEHYQYNSWKFIPYIWADKILSLVTDRIICCCDSLKADIVKVERIRPGKFATILSAIDLEGFNPTAPASQMRKRLKLGDSDLIVGNVSSMSPRKGHAYLIRAFSLVKKAVPESQLVLLGQEEPSLKKGLYDLAKELKIQDSVHFLGRQERCEDFYNIMDVFALSSLHEGIPLVILEAMRIGIPVVATDAGGVGEMIENNKTGLIVPRHDPEALAEGIIRLLLDKQKRADIARAARENAFDRFKPPRYVSELEDLYSTVAGKHAAG